MSKIFADDIAALIPDRRIMLLARPDDADKLGAILAQAFGVGRMQVEIASVLWQRRVEQGEIYG